MLGIGVRGKVIKHDYFHRDYYIYSDTLSQWCLVECHSANGKCCSRREYGRGELAGYNFEAVGERAEAMLLRLEVQQLVEQYNSDLLDNEEPMAVKKWRGTSSKGDGI